MEAGPNIMEEEKDCNMTERDCARLIEWHRRMSDLGLLREECEKYGLEHREILKNYSDADLMDICSNKDGSPVWVMAAAEDMHPWIMPAALIMLAEIHSRGHSVSNLADATERLKNNGFSIARQIARWWNIGRYTMMWDAMVYSNMCYCQRLPGWRVSKF